VHCTLIAWANRAPALYPYREREPVSHPFRGSVSVPARPILEV
jgi:hypothetical protein